MILWCQYLQSPQALGYAPLSPHFYFSREDFLHFPPSPFNNRRTFSPTLCAAIGPGLFHFTQIQWNVGFPNGNGLFFFSFFLNFPLYFMSLLDLSIFSLMKFISKGDEKQGIFHPRGGCGFSTISPLLFPPRGILLVSFPPPFKGFFACRCTFIHSFRFTPYKSTPPIHEECWHTLLPTSNVTYPVGQPWFKAPLISSLTSRFPFLFVWVRFSVLFRFSWNWLVPALDYVENALRAVACALMFSFPFWDVSFFWGPLSGLTPPNVPFSHTVYQAENHIPPPLWAKFQTGVKKWWPLFFLGGDSFSSFPPRYFFPLSKMKFTRLFGPFAQLILNGLTSFVFPDPHFLPPPSIPLLNPYHVRSTCGKVFDCSLSSCVLPFSLGFPPLPSCDMTVVNWATKAMLVLSLLPSNLFFLFFVWCRFFVPDRTPLPWVLEVFSKFHSFFEVIV